MAISSLIAVLGAVWEHEDLILQEEEPPETWRAEDDREAARHGARVVVSEGQRGPESTGTEGTFRADKHVMRIFQREGLRDEPRRPLIARSPPMGARRWGVHALWRPAIVGVVELRL